MYCAYASFVCLSVWILIDKPTISIIGYTAKNIHPNIIAAHANTPVKIKITHPKYGSIVTSYAILKIVFVTAKKNTKRSMFYHVYSAANTRKSNEHKQKNISHYIADIYIQYGI